MHHDLPGARRRVLWLSTVAFTLLFAVWLMLGVLGIPMRQDLGLTDTQLGWLGAAAILSGSLLRLNFGIWADRYGGRNMLVLLLLLSAVPTYWVSRVENFNELLVCTLLFGLAGNSFTVGIAWVSAWFPARQQGTALGVFGAGNVGASVTKFLGPAVLAAVPAAGFFGGLVPGGWRFVPVVYAGLLVLMAAAVLVLSPTPDRKPGQGRPLADTLTPLRYVQVWRFSLYYVVVFGAYVALSVWLPKYYVDVYGLDLTSASLLTALFIFPASLLRPLGGWLSDRYGPRGVMYAVFAAMTVASLVLSVPNGRFVVDGLDGRSLSFGLGPAAFTALVFVVGCGMGVGKAAVYKYIPNYYPKDVGAVGGLVGMLGALGGFVLPPAFAYLRQWTGVPQTTFLVLFLLTAGSFAWLHAAVLRLRFAERTRVMEPVLTEPALAAEPA